MRKRIGSFFDFTRKQLFVGTSQLAMTPKLDLADLAMIFFFAQRLLTYLFSTFLGVKGILLFMGILGLLYLAAVIQRFRQSDSQALFYFLFIVLLLIFAIFVSLVRNPDLKFWIFGSDWNLLTQLADTRKALFGLLLVILVKDRARILRNAFYASLGMFAYLFYQIFLYEYLGSWGAYFSLLEGSSRYNMSLGYEMTFVVLVFLTMAFVKGSLLLLTLSGLGGGLAIYYGSRGVVVLILAYICLFLVFWSGGSWKISRPNIRVKFKHLQSFAAMLLVIVLAIAVLIPANKILVDHLDLPGVTLPDEDDPAQAPEDEESRTVQSIIEGEFFEPSGRLTIWKLSLRAFLASPFLGQGFYGDRLYVGRNFNWGYSHNFILEILSQYGLWGLLFLIAFFYLIIRSLARGGNRLDNLVLILFASLCTKLLVSDSYLFNEHFWILLGLLLMDLPLYEKMKKRTRCLSLAAMTLLALSAFSLFLVKDTRDQSFKTIHFDQPTLLFTSYSSSKSNRSIARILSYYDLTGVNFLNAGQLELIQEADTEKVEVNKKLTSEDLAAMQELGWTFEDGGYRYENAYIRPPQRQEENRLASLAFFEAHDLGQPVAYRPPYNVLNSTIQFRVMEHYAFAERLVKASSARPYKTLSLPQSLDLAAVRLEWEDEEAKDQILAYLNKAAEEGALAVVALDSNRVNWQQLGEFARAARDLGFTSIAFRELYQEAYDFDSALGFDNYLENTYTGHILARLIG